MRTTRVKAEHDLTLEADDYARVALGLLDALPGPEMVWAYSLLVRESRGGIPTGRWTVLGIDRTLIPPRWAWPPVAAHHAPDAQAIRSLS